MIQSRSDLLQYSKLTYPGRYQVYWHNALVARRLEAIAFGRLHRLILGQPPQTGKSELVAHRFPAWALGINPDLRIVLLSHTADLAERAANEVRRAISSSGHRRAFPHSRLKTRARRLTDDDIAKNTIAHFDIVGHRGYFRAVGIMGSITGWSADLIIIDDPVKNREEADSPTIQEKLRREFDTSIMTRLQQAAALVMIMTRWHEEDLVGYALRQAKLLGDREHWEQVTLPALMDLDPEHRHPEDPRAFGEALCPELYTASHYEGRKLVIDPRDFDSIYQQRPSAESGGIFNETWWRFYRLETLPPITRTFITVDAGFKKTGKSWVVMQVWGMAGPNIYLLRNHREHLSYTETRDRFVGLCDEWPEADTALIEEAANGIALIDDLRGTVYGTRVQPVPATESKLTRASFGSVLVKQGRVWLPLHDPRVTEHDGFIDEHKRFAGPGERFDDQVDAAAHMFGHIRREFGDSAGGDWWS